jgi:hypothetical protein
MRLETSRGTGIKHVQELELTEYEINWDRYFERTYDRAKRRTAPSALYNCHGLTFASRRTKIYLPSQIQLILADDRYEEIPLAIVMPGDIAVYVSDRTGDINHSGIVVAYDQNLVTPMICSKWGKGGEYVHPAHHCPPAYGPTVKYFRCKL